MLATLVCGLAFLQPGGEPLARIKGDAFEGGAKAEFGANWFGQAVNYVYAEPTQARSSMRTAFGLLAAPNAPCILRLKARSDDARTNCRIQIAINRRTVFEGRNGFSPSRWSKKSFPIPDGALRRGANELIVRNAETKGELGQPPWFMVAEAVVAPNGWNDAPPLEADFYVALPVERTPLPTPLPPGQSPGFRYRGIKGWNWPSTFYLKEIPYLAKLKMNFLMNCYSGMPDVEATWWAKGGNEWWKPFSDKKRAAIAAIVAACKKFGIDFCFSINPNLGSSRALDYNSPQDVEALSANYAWVQGLGVRWFNISLDDISRGIDPAGQAKMANAVLMRLRRSDPKAELIFTPTIYWGDAADPKERAYLSTLGRDLDPDVWLFWTGNQVVGKITRKAAEGYKAVVKHRLFVWDNYPVNDSNATLHLGPVTGRDPDVYAVAEGYMSNSMCHEREANRIPLATCADYAYNPQAYDPARAIGQAILLNSSGRGQAAVLKRLVEAYPGMLLSAEGTSFNPVRAQYRRLAATPHSRYVAAMYIELIATLAADLRRAFPRGFEAEEKVLHGDLAWMRSEFADQYGNKADEGALCLHLASRMERAWLILGELGRQRDRP